jgi:hypothetical protein
MKVIKFAPGLVPVLKHGTHDQKDHGNWATGSQGSVSELSNDEIRDVISNSNTVDEMYQKVAARLGKSMKPQLADLPEGEINFFRGVQDVDRDAQRLLDGKVIFTPFQTWGQGIYVSSEKDYAATYGEIIGLKLDKSAKLVEGEIAWSKAFSLFDKESSLNMPKIIERITSGKMDNFSDSDIANIYWASKGYDGYSAYATGRTEVVLFNADKLTVNKTDIGSAVKKHQEHDQSSHGSWATGELSGEQKAVVSAWTSLSNKSSWRQIANDLSEGKTPNASESDTKTVKTLVDAIKQNGVIPAEALGRAELLTTGLRWQGAVPKVGDTLKNELSSATLDEKTSERFSQYSDFGGSKGKPVIFHYGFQTKGLDVNRAGADTFADEQEWLVSGTFKITDRYSENGITHLNLKPVEAVKKHQEHDQSTHGNWATGSSESGLDAMPYEWKPEFKERLTAPVLGSKELNLGREQLKQVAEAPIAIRLDGGELNYIVGLGRFKTLEEQLDLKNMDGYREARQDLEVGLWGVPETDTGPIYGYFDTPLHPSVDNQTRSYGDIKVILKDSVAGRTTITPGDSANHGLTPVLVTDARKGNLSLEQVDSAYLSRPFQSGATTVSRPVNSVRKIESIDYFEAQIHGGISLKDIKSVDIRNQSGYSPPVSESTIKTLEQMGIEVTRDDK